MKRLLVIAVAAAAMAGCSMIRHSRENPYTRPLFYARYLNPDNPLDRQIQETVTALQSNPNSAPLHNQLGQLLAQKGFPKDAETEFERAVNADRRFYPAWYNLGLVRAARSDFVGARVGFNRTVHFKPGHAAALFQLGLMEEERGNVEAAVSYYAKAFAINRSLLDVKVNPRILDTKLVHLALVKNYPNEHTRESQLFQGTPQGYAERVSAAAPSAPSPQAPAEKIVTPSAPVTDPGTQTPAPNVPPPPPPGM